MGPKLSGSLAFGVALWPQLRRRHHESATSGHTRSLLGRCRGQVLGLVQPRGEAFLEVAAHRAAGVPWERSSSCRRRGAGLLSGNLGSALTARGEHWQAHAGCLQEEANVLVHFLKNSIHRPLALHRCRSPGRSLARLAVDAVFVSSPPGVGPEGPSAPIFWRMSRFSARFPSGTWSLVVFGFWKRSVDVLDVLIMTCVTPVVMACPLCASRMLQLQYVSRILAVSVQPRRHSMLRRGALGTKGAEKVWRSFGLGGNCTNLHAKGLKD